MGRRMEESISDGYVKQTDLVYNQFNTVDVRYVFAINRLLSKAEKHANNICGRKPSMGSKKRLEWEETINTWNAEWTRCFHDKMNEEARLAGLRR